MLTMGSLFAGIGGFDLGFERAGFKTVWQVEKNAYCRRVLRRHFPDADRRVTDVRFAGARNLLPVDVICAGFPCQPVSIAGSRRAQLDERWMWPECARIISELRPRFALLENVPGLLTAGMGDVLGDLSALGYDAEWQVVSAADIGADHIRERVWILAYPECGRRVDSTGAYSSTHYEIWDSTAHQQIRDSIADSPEPSRTLVFGEDGTRRSIKPGMALLADGLSEQLDAIRALGNSVVPQIPELIARGLKKALMADQHCTIPLKENTCAPSPTTST